MGRLWVTSLILRRGSLARALGVPRSVVGFTGGLKRMLDISIGSVSLLLISPLLLSIAALIKLQDGGGVIVRQQRVGRNGETFAMLKFRSMAVDAEARMAELMRQDARGGELFKLRGDPRITRLGMVLRRASSTSCPSCSTS